MTDRELLELAAKAAGWVSWDWLAGDGLLNVYNAEGRHAVFAPLIDDGDALRLACDLGLNVYPVARTSSGQACSAVGTMSGGRLAEVVDPNSTQSATRRAIVHAAAEIGKTQ